MKKQANAKLSLDRETLASLSPAEMAQVNGAFWTQVVKVTLRYCTTVTTAISHPRLGCNEGK